MPGPADELIRWATRAAAPPGTDRDLLARFAAGRDEAAFAELVRRHGPVVFGVCRRVVGHRQDAEDAFQATFLVLARKADRVGRPDALGGWLYAVAVRVARKARRAADRRRGREVVVHPVPDVPTDTAERRPELAGVIDEEIAALPAWYRDAVVLCDLRGQSRAEAAASLGLPEGTLSSRLNAGRKKLAARLARRGVGVPAAGWAATFGTDAVAVSPRVLMSTVDAALAGSAGGVLSANVETLATEWGWGVGKVKLLAAAVVAVGVGFGTVVGMSGEKPNDEPPKPVAPAPKPEPAAKAEPPADKPEKPGKPRLVHVVEVPGETNRAPVWDPDGRFFAVRIADRFDVYDGQSLNKVREFPAGRHQATLLGYARGPTGLELVIYRQGRATIHAISEVEFWSVRDSNPRVVEFDPALGSPTVLLGDGKTVLTYSHVGGRTANRMIRPRSGDFGGPAPPPPAVKAEATFRFVDVTNPEAVPQVVRVDNEVAGFTVLPDGRRLVVMVVRPDGTWAVQCLGIADGKVVWERLFEKGATDRRYPGGLYADPDGKIVTASISYPAPMPMTQPDDRRPPRSFGPRGEPQIIMDAFVLDAATGETRAKLDGSGEGYAWASSVSHDGRVIVGTYQPREDDRGVSVYQTRLWEARTGAVLKTWNSSSALTAFSPTRPTLTITERFDVPTGKLNANGTAESDKWSVIGLWDVLPLMK